MKLRYLVPLFLGSLSHRLNDSYFLSSYLDPLVDCSDAGIFLDLGIKISLDMKQWKQEHQVLKTRLNTGSKTAHSLIIIVERNITTTLKGQCHKDFAVLQ